PLARGDVTENTGDQSAIVGVQWAQTDLDRKLAAILTPRDEIEAGAHGSRGGRRVIAGPMSHVCRAEPLGYQDFDRLPQQILAAVAEHPLHLRVEEHDPALLIHTDDPIRRGFQQPAEFRLRRFRLGPNLVLPDEETGARDP